MGPILSLVPDGRWLISMKSNWCLEIGTNNPIAMSALRTRLRETTKSLHLISLWEIFRGCQATDPRDAFSLYWDSRARRQ
jgi:hypothetical protein